MESSMHMDGTQSGRELPMASTSEAEYAPLAPSALALLKRHNAEDCIDALGLRPYVRS